MKNSNTHYKTLLVLLLVAIPVITFSQGKVKTLKAKNFYQKLETAEDPVVIDVRPVKKYMENRIKNAILAESLADVRQLVKEMPKDQTIFLYCQKGDRSAKAKVVLEELNFTNVYELKKGLNTWIKAELPLDTTQLKFEQ